MNSQSPSDIYQQMLGETATVQNQPSAYNRISTAIDRKKQQLAQRADNKIQKLDALHQTVQNRDSFDGQVTGLGLDSDYAREFFQAGFNGFGQVLSGAGQMVDNAFAAIPGIKEADDAILSLFDEDTANQLRGYTIGQAAESYADSLSATANQVDQQQFGSFNQSIEDSTPQGDLFDPSTWTTQGDVSAEGVLGLIANMAGQFTPQALAMVMTRGASVAQAAAATGTVGGLQAGGGAASEVEQLLAGKSHEELLESSGFYRDLIDSDMSQEQAKQSLINVAKDSAFLGAAPLGALGGAATSYVFGPLQSKLSGNFLGRALSSIGISGVEEGIQETAEGISSRAATNLAIDGNQDLTEGSLTDFVLGAGFGSGLGGIATSLDAVKSAKATVGKAVQAGKDAAANDTAEKIRTALDTGDVSGFTDTYDRKNYDPSQAAAILYEIANREDDAPAKSTKAREQIKELIADLDAEIVLTEEELEGLDASDKEQKTKDQLRKRYETNIESYKRHLTNVQAINNKMTLDEVQEQAPEQIVEAVRQGDEQARSSLLTLTMMAPERVNEATIDSLIADTQIPFTQEQRDYLEKFQLARVEQNKLKTSQDVSRDIFEGGLGYKGLPEYEGNVISAINSGDANRARKELKGLKDFLSSRTTKLNAINKATEKAKATGQPVQIVPDTSVGWRETLSPLSTKRLREVQGLAIGPNPGRLLSGVELETQAIQATYDKLLAAATASFKKASPSPKPVSEVSNVSESVQTPAPQKKTGAQNEATKETVPAPQEVTEEPDTTLVSKSNNPFTQRKGKASDKSGQALTLVDGFISSALSDPNTVSQYLADTPSPKQQSFLGLAFDTINAWNSQITFKEKKPEYWDEDPIQYFVEDGQLPENVKTAISFAALNYLTENAFESPYNTKAQVNEILNRPEGSPILPHERPLITAGQSDKLVIAKLGKAARQALGIKEDPSLPLNLIPKLEGSLGAHALAVLLEQGLVERLDLPAEIFQREGTQTTKATHPFVRIKRTWNADGTAGPIADRVERLAQPSKDTGGVLAKVFKAEPGLKDPSFTPVTKVQKFAKGTRQLVSDVQKRILKKEGEKAHYLNPDMLQLYRSLPRDLVEYIAGVRDPASQVVHKANRLGLDGKNQGLLRELDHLDNFLEQYTNQDKKLYEPVYFGRSVWKMNRVGLDSNTINPQTSKIHRHMLYMGDWQTTVPIDINSPVYQQFLLAVADALDIKTDKQRNHRSLEQVQDRINSPEVKAAVEAIKKTLLGEVLNSTDTDAIKNVVPDGDHSFHLLDGLTALAQMELNKANGKFKTTIMREVDGVTNGPMFTLLQLGAGAGDSFKRLLNKGGFYFNDDTVDGFSEWKSQAGNEDLYQSLAFDVTQVLRGLYQSKPEMKPAILAGFEFLGRFTQPDSDGNEVVTSQGRNAVKTPLTGFAFGSSLDTAVEGMAADVIDAFYSKIEEAVRNSDQAALKRTLESINTFVTAGGAKAFNTDIDLAVALETELSSKQEAAIIKGFSTTFGLAVKDVMESRFEDLITLRNSLNTSARSAFNLYQAAYQAARNEYQASLGDPKQELTQAQEQEVRDRVKALEPLMHTPFSKQSQQLAAGIRAGKVSTAISQDPLYESVTGLGRKVPTNVGGKVIQSLRGRPLVREEIDPGVAMVIMGIHSFDSTVSSLAYEERGALNIHDAHGLGLKDVTKGAKSLNQHTFEQMVNYSLPIELAATLSRTLKAFTEFANANPSLQKELKAAYESIQQDVRKSQAKVSDKVKYAKDPVTTFSQVVTQQAIQATQRKLDVLADIKLVDQYALEEGHYKPTTKSRKVLDTVKEKLSKFNTGETKELSPVTESPWGELGEPLTHSDRELVRQLPDGKTNAREIFPILKQRIQLTQSGRIRDFNLRLLEALQSQVSPTLNFEWIRPDTASTEQTEDLQRAKAWYALSNDGETIYLKSPEFKHSGVTPELLLHELTHAAVAKAINNPSAANQQYVDELSALLAAARKRVNSRQELQKYANAVENIQELVAYGMTDSGFQRDVLNMVRLESRTLKESLVSGIRSLVESLTGILFKGTSKSVQEVNESGLTILITNTAALFDTDSGKSELVLKQEDTRLNDYTMEQVFDGLSNGRPSSPHLKNLLSNLVDKLHGPYGAYAAHYQQTTAYTPEEAYLKYLATGKAVFTSEANHRLNLTRQESFVLDQVEVTIREGINESPAVYRELATLYREARTRLKGSNQLSDQEYSFIFTPQSSDQATSDYLSRFSALVLTYPPLRSALANMETQINTRSLTSMKLGEAIQTIFNRILSVIQGRLTNTFEGQRADDKARALVEQLVDMASKRKVQVYQEDASGPGKLETLIQSFSDNLRTNIDKAGKSDLVRKSPFTAVRFAGAAASTLAGDRAGQLMDVLERIRNQNFKRRQGIVAGLVTEARGATDNNQVFHELLRETNRHEQERKHVIDETAAMVRSAFVNDGQDLSREQREALTRALIRTDAASLLDYYSVSQIADLVSDPEELENQLRAHESELNSTDRHYYIKSARDLGYHLATGENVGDNLMLNARNIAYMSNTPKKVTGVDSNIERMLPTIDRLVTLNALKYLNDDIRATALDVIRTELRREGVNGVETILKLHKDLQKDALQTSFGNEQVHFIKGYVKEIYDPRREIVIASLEEGLELEAMGYKKVSNVQPDPADPDTTIKAMYLIRDKGLNPHLTGIFSYTGKRAKGSRIHSGLTRVNGEGVNQYSQNKNTKVQQETQQRIAAMFKPDANYNPAKRKQNRLVPVLNPNGDAVNFRYMMRDEVRDQQLDRDNQIDTVLGAMAGSTLDKVNTAEHNKIAVQALYDQYQGEYASKPESYIEVSPNSPDEKIRETYNLLPNETKQAIKEVWGQDGMQVRIDLYDINFGYRKYSLSDIFDKDDQHRSIMEGLFADFVEVFFGKKAALRIAQAEDVWQELVRLTKDILVIKNLFTLLGNVSSNVSLLLWMGVSPKDIIKQHSTAIRGLINYQRDRKELSRLQRSISMGTVSGPVLVEAQNRIVELEDAIARNPMKELIDAGLFQTIVEDVDNDDDRFSYTSRLSQFMEGKTQWLPDEVKSVGKTLLMTHDTPAYKLLSQATSMSDFVARYTLHQHMTTRKVNPLGTRESIQLAVDAFVNYDIPSHRSLQYLNDMGLVWFTKYYIRIQKVLMHLYRDNPGRSIAMVTLENLFPGLSTIVDSGFWNRIGNPFSVGFLKFPEAVDEIIFIKTLLSPFK